jgi:hypothetical protein
MPFFHTLFAEGNSHWNHLFEVVDLRFHYVCIL